MQQGKSFSTTEHADMKTEGGKVSFLTLKHLDLTWGQALTMCQETAFLPGTMNMLEGGHSGDWTAWKTTPLSFTVSDM